MLRVGFVHKTCAFVLKIILNNITAMDFQENLVCTYVGVGTMGAGGAIALAPPPPQCLPDHILNKLLYCT